MAGKKEIGDRCCKSQRFMGRSAHLPVANPLQPAGRFLQNLQELVRELWKKLQRSWNLNIYLTRTSASCSYVDGTKVYLRHIPSSSSRVTVGSTYSHQCFPSVDTGISQLDHLQARWMHTQATTGGLYCRQNVVKCRLRGRIRPGKKQETERGGERTDIQYIEFKKKTWKRAFMSKTTVNCEYTCWWPWSMMFEPNPYSLEQQQNKKTYLKPAN